MNNNNKRKKRKSDKPLTREEELLLENEKTVKTIIKNLSSSGRKPQSASHNGIKA
jgi:hypothetical protein